MTTPSQARSSKRDGVRTYPWPPHPPHEFEVISVTSAINGGLPKPFLQGWAANQAAECAINDIEIVQAMLNKGDRKAAYDHIRNARNRDRDEKADRGTVVHAALEGYLGGKVLTEDEIKERFREKRVNEKKWKAGIGMVNGLMEFLFDEEPEIIWSEATVFSRTHEYAGTMDVLARLRIGGSWEPTVIDAKTSKRIYNEVAYQLCAYARADFVGLDDGTELPLLPEQYGSEPPRYGRVIRLLPNGKYEPATYALTDEIFERFLAMLTVARLAGIEDRVKRP